MNTQKFYINGEWVSPKGEANLAVINPSIAKKKLYVFPMTVSTNWRDMCSPKVTKDQETLQKEYE